MGQGYQDRDIDIIDYQLWNLTGVPRKLRGPAPPSLAEGEYITCVGAAQTFGCYSEKPFPALLQEALGIPVLNFGVAGAGPSLFTRQHFLDHINGGKLVVLQVLSGRSTGNSLFQPVNSGEMLNRRSDGVELGAAPMYAQLLQSKSRDEVEAVIRETRENWLREFNELINRITKPVILAWFSVRSPDYRESYSSVECLFGKFPQLVNREMIDRIRPRVDRYVEYVSDAGLPQPLVSKATGKPITIKMRADLSDREKKVNDYYPSPEMHRGLATSLVPVLQEMLLEQPAKKALVDEPLLVSLHLPKTGGTSLLSVLKEKYGPGFRSAYGRYASPGSSVLHEGEPVSCVHGHNIVKMFAPILESRRDQQWITFLREPLASAISLYYFARKNLNKNPEVPLFDDRGLEYWLLNQQPPKWPNPPGYPFNRYTRSVQSTGLKVEEFAFIGITERFDESMLCLYAELGWKPIKYRAENRGRYEPPEIDPEVMARFKEINAGDYALYEYAQRRLDDIIDSYGSTFARDLADLVS